MLAYNGRGWSGGTLGHPPIPFSTRATSSFHRHTPKTFARKWQIWRKLGQNWAPGSVVEGAMDGRKAPHTPTNGLGVSLGCMRT